jgi:hypothetical protein
MVTVTFLLIGTMPEYLFSNIWKQPELYEREIITYQERIWGLDWILA